MQIEYVTEMPGRMSVEVFDLTGRRVRTLGSWELEAGAHQLRWNGLDERGRQVASGAYLVRIRGIGSQAVGKAMLVR